MPKRIPHEALTVITGRETTEGYLRMQKAMGRFYLRHFLRCLEGLANGGSFLEIGPGPGYQTAIIARRMPGVRITALEYSADMAVLARGYLAEQGVGDRVNVIQGSVEDQPLMRRLGAFDLIYSTFSLHHWEDPVGALRNLHGALKEDGCMLLYDFVRGGPLYHLPLKRGIWESVRASYRPEEIWEMLEGLGMGDYTTGKRYPYLWVTVSR
ncbi:MAG: class I SAM-dependent methyltransferase [Spirochaetes bacterium]|nr:class I SAM-dependent methyltransferase [Spirochaetota bacterium]